MANALLPTGALTKPLKGSTAKAKRRGKRLEAKADRLVYAAVDARDGHRCRVCLEYRGLDIQRHHIVSRAQQGPTTTANVVSLCAECHLVGVHGKKLTISGNADERLQVKCATATLNGEAIGWAIWEGAA